MSAPVMFISHGSPMWALEPGPAGAQLAALRPEFSEVRAILVISPHWITKGLTLTAAEDLQTIHDFGGFPQALYQLQYPAKGEPDLASVIQSLLQTQGFEVCLSADRGLDHGAWVPLIHLMPDAEHPVLQLSLDMNLTPGCLLELGRILNQLRDQGVAIIATGGITHNLYDMQPASSPPLPYAGQFQLWVRNRVCDRDINALCQPHLETPDFQRSHPSAEHYLPLLIAMGASSWQDSLTILESPIEYGAISMESYFWS